jgi:hypothetical protein
MTYRLANSRKSNFATELRDDRTRGGVPAVKRPSIALRRHARGVRETARAAQQAHHGAAGPHGARSGPCGGAHRLVAYAGPGAGGHSQDRAQCTITLSASPLLKHYQRGIQ